MLRMYKYRIYPSGKQKEKLIHNFNICKIIYNDLLNQTINTYNLQGITLGKFDYNNYLTNKYNEIYSQVKQNVSDRVSKAFQNFFGRINDKRCKKKGFPRFKSSVKSITYPQFGFQLSALNKCVNKKNKKLYISKIGNLPIVSDRIPKGKIKTLTIKINKAGQYFAVFSCEIENSKIIHNSDKNIGIDVGLESFATLSNGIKIENSKYLIKSERKLNILHKRLSRKKKGSNNRFKAKFKLSKQYIKVTNQRIDFMHKLSYEIAKAYSFIVVEDLNIMGMVKNHNLAKSINDASWNKFIQMLSYKAVVSGGQFVKINPRNTSKTCSNCENIQDIQLSERQFKCLKCGFVCNRDLNASINILKVGLDKPELNVCEHNVRPISLAIVNEAGTIH